MYKIGISNLHLVLILILICSSDCIQFTVTNKISIHQSSKHHTQKKQRLGLNGQSSKKNCPLNLQENNIYFRFIQGNKQQVKKAQKRQILHKEIQFFRQTILSEELVNGVNYIIIRDGGTEFGQRFRNQIKWLKQNNRINMKATFKNNFYLPDKAIKQKINKNHQQKIIQDNNDTKSQQNNKQNIVRNLQATNAINSIELIKNNRFTTSVCTWFYCEWNTTNYRSDFIPYWEPYPEIEIGLANLFNPSLERRYVIELTTTKPTCIRQLVSNIPSGLYDFKYVFAPHFLMSLQSSEIFVFFNDSKIDERKAINHQWNRASVQKIPFEENNTSIYIKFCGNSNLLIRGNLLGEVSLKRTSGLLITVPTNSTITTDSSNQNSQNIDNQIYDNSTQNSNDSNINDNNNIEQNDQIAAINNSTFSNGQNYNDFGNSTSFNFSILNSTIGRMNETNGTGKLMSYSEYVQYLLKFANEYLSNPIASHLLKSSVIRKLFTKGFSFFINIDHLWLYIYHKRSFYTQINAILIWINEFQSSKWNILPANIENISLNFQQIQNSLNQKFIYMPQNILYIQNQSRSFLVMTFKFFIINIPFVLTIFIVGKLLHRLLCKFHFPQILKQFSLNSFLIIILLQGNSESFTYFLLSDILTLFNLDLKMKIINIFSVIAFYTLIFFLIALPFIVRYLYRKKIHVQFYDKCRNSLRGSTFYMVDFGLFNILLGSIHIICENVYRTQLILLFSVEFLFLTYTISNFNRQKQVLINKLTIWMTLWASLLRMVLITSYFLYINSPEGLTSKLDQVQENCIILYFFLLIFSLIDFGITLLLKICISIYHKVSTTFGKSQNKREEEKKQIVEKKNKEIIKISKIQSLNQKAEDNIKTQERVLQQKQQRKTKYQKKVILRKPIKASIFYQNQKRNVLNIKIGRKVNIAIISQNQHDI